MQELARIVLIDEIEGHLHSQIQSETLPFLIKLFPKVQFILTSHSPVFLLGMEKVFGEEGFLLKELPSEAKITPREFSEYQSIVEGLELSDAIKKLEKDFVVFVEGQTDKTILETAWGKLFSNRPMPFALVNAYDCNLIRNTLKRDEVFTDSPKKKFMELLDFDDAFDAWNSGVNGGKDKWEIEAAATEQTGILAAHPRRKGFLALLPVPSFRSKYAGMRFGGDSCLSIDLLFQDC